MKAQPPTQEPTVLPLTFEYLNNTVFISEVVFHADEAVLVNGQPEKRWVIVVDDITTEPISGTDATVVWKDGAASNPAAYWGGKCNALVSAKFNAQQCGMLGYANIWAKATGTDGFDLPPRLLNDNYEYPPTEILKAFEQGRVLGYEAFAFEWTIAESEAALETAPKAKFTTQFRLYVTHDKPNVGDGYGITKPDSAPLGYYAIHETSIHHACVSAHQLSTKDEIVEAIFTKYFKDLKAKDIKGDPLTYWGKGEESSCTNLEGFFKTNDGTCGTWAIYMKEILRIHNINTDKLGIETNPVSISSITLYDIESKILKLIKNEGYMNPTISIVKKLYFMVKKWEDKPNGQYYELGDEYFDAGGILGIPAQNKDDPRSIFYDHALLQYTTANGKKIFFDPSYGVKKDQLNDYENAAIKVVQAIYFSIKSIDITTGQFFNTHCMYVLKNNTNNLQELNFTISE